MTEAEAAYVGMAIDTDGWVGSNGKEDKLGHLNGVQIGFANTNPELISAVLRAVGAGRVHMVLPPKCKPVLRWNLMARNDVRALAEQIAPYSQKAQRALVMLEYKKEEEANDKPRTRSG